MNGHKQKIFTLKRSKDKFESKFIYFIITLKNYTCVILRIPHHALVIFTVWYKVL